MPLVVSEIRDLRDYTQAFANNIISRDVTQNVGAGYNFIPPMGHETGQHFENLAYDFIRDRIMFRIFGIKELPGGAVGVEPGVISIDALCRNESIGWYVPTLDFTGQLVRWKTGQPNLQNGTQKLYGFANVAGNFHFELNPNDGSQIVLDLWPNVVNDFTGGQATTGNAGFWTDLGAQIGWNVTIFDGITDSTLMPEIVIGNSHPKGLALMHVFAVNLDGGTNLTARWTWIDLDTGNAVGLLNIPIEADTNSLNPTAEPSIDGKDFPWLSTQFVPDEGSTFAKPKGELHVFMDSGSVNSFDLAGQTITAPEQTFVSTILRQYVSVFDFNPFGVTAGTVRTHLRNIFKGSVHIPYEPIISGGNTTAPPTQGNDNFSVRMRDLFYHPPSRTYISIQGTSEFTNSEGADDPRIGDSRIIRFRRARTISSIGKPVPESAVTESRTIRARTIALDDIGEVANSAPVTFSSFKVSTRDEQFDGTTQTTTPYVVAQGEIDDDGHLEVREQGGVDDGGGILLVETTDYTVNHGTGTLTPVGSWPTETIHIRYRHRSVRVGTGHGTLLSATGTTDAEGVAIARIQYGTNIEGELDELEVTA